MRTHHSEMQLWAKQGLLWLHRGCTRTGGLESSSPQDLPASRSGLARALPSTLRFRVLFQWFFTALSVRPGSDLAISAHLLPILCVVRLGLL